MTKWGGGGGGGGRRGRRKKGEGEEGGRENGCEISVESGAQSAPH
jgi:hypothetical protein